VRVECFLRDSARRAPDKVALVVGEARPTYADLDATADRLAQALRQRGVGRGDRVVLFLDNSAEAVVGLFAALKAGSAFSILNPSTKAEKLGFVLNNCRARALVTQARLLPAAAPAVAQAPSVAATLVVEPGPGADGPAAPAVRGGCWWRQALADAPSGRPPAPAGIDLDLAALLYTSGSTGSPKGAMMTHRNLVTAVTSVTQYLENTDDDVLLNVLPLSFGYGLNQVLTAFRVGATLVLEKGFAFPYPVLQKLRQERATGFALVPTIAAILLQLRDVAPGSFPHLRYVTNAAAALSPAQLRRLQELLPTTRLYSMYGQSECTRTLYLPPDQLAVRPTSVGVAIPNTEAYVVDDEGRRVGPGVVGQLVVRGGHVMAGYWELPAETERALRPGPLPGERVLYSGDLFRTDEEGYFYFVARKDDIIKTRGEKVSPKEVEDCIHHLPGVADVAVVGVPDPVLGQAVAAVVVPAEGAQLAEADVKRHCAAHLEDYMVPKVVEFRAELPKTGSGKVVRREVRPGQPAPAGPPVTPALALPGPGPAGR
jgi:amino acid adenylation domain-containing protein